MPATRESKQQEVEALRERFERATAAVLVGFNGLNVKRASDLRNEFRKIGVDYKVAKNTLIKLAIAGSPLETEELTSQLVGETAIAWSYEDPSAAAKVIKAFRKDDVNAAALTVKCGVLENQVMEGSRVETELASMPGKDEVRAMLLAQLMAPMQQLVRQLSAPAQNLAYALDARQRQLEENQ
ncbi:MAG: 50S ribosomal protein L10 [Myxococcales bacterium]|nr:50S ribosomal protein L10 [Myxococcales bacterium]